jgi:hypothetical protein
MPARQAIKNILDWLLEGDPSIRWQALRNLAAAPNRVWESERSKVALEGCGARLLALQQSDGNWGRGLYQPKWTSTTYTLLLLRRIGLEARHPAAIKACRLFLDHALWHDGGINVTKSTKRSETCITGMVLALGSYFRLDDERLDILVQYLLGDQMPDGGWNCRRHLGATHGSFHTTINVLEGLREYADARGKLSKETISAEERAREFLLIHRLFRSHRTGAVANPEFKRLMFPPQWHYDVLRALEYFASCDADRDDRLKDGIDVVLSKREDDGTWLCPRPYSGTMHFQMEKPGSPSRWNTLRAMSALKWWNEK